MNKKCNNKILFVINENKHGIVTKIFIENDKQKQIVKKELLKAITQFEKG